MKNNRASSQASKTHRKRTPRKTRSGNGTTSSSAKVELNKTRSDALVRASKIRTGTRTSRKRQEDRLVIPRRLRVPRPPVFEIDFC